METKVYPYKADVVVIEPLDKATVAAAIVAQREHGLTKAQAIGPVLNGSNDVAAFNKAWGEVEAERVALRAIATSDYDTEAKYVTDLTKTTSHLDSAKWVAGIKAEQGIMKWSDLQSVEVQLGT